MTTHKIETISPTEKRIVATIDPATIKKAKRASIKIKTDNNLQEKKYGGSYANSRFSRKQSEEQLSKEQLSEEEMNSIHQKLCQESCKSVLSKQNIDYQGEPLIGMLEVNQDGSLTYRVSIEVYPEIEHVNWENASIRTIEATSDEEALQKTCDRLKLLGFEAAAQSTEMATQWSDWIIDIFQRQQLREEIINELLKQNTVADIPQRTLEGRYQQLKQERSTEEDAVLREDARKYIATDILLKAYAKEHDVKLDRDLFLEKTKKAAQNPFIVSHIKDQRQLPYYLYPRIVEETILDHLAERAARTVETEARDVLVMKAFNRDPNAAAEQSSSVETPQHSSQEAEEVAC